MTFNRPHYSYKFINSLEKCTNINNMDWIILQDGAVNKFSNKRYATNDQMEQNLKIMKSANLPNKQIRKNDYNLSIALQRDKMFDLFNEGYDLILQFEDDIILGKYAVRIFKLMMNQFDNSCSSIYREKSYNDIINVEDKKDLTYNEIKWDKIWCMFTFGIWEKEFRKIESKWNEYINIVNNVDYRNRDHELINNTFNTPSSGSDAVIQFSMKTKNIKKLNPAISRAKYIGMDGVHYSPDSYMNKHEHGREGPLEFEEDKNIKKFRLKQNC